MRRVPECGSTVHLERAAWSRRRDHPRGAGNEGSCRLGGFAFVDPFKLGTSMVDDAVELPRGECHFKHFVIGCTTQKSCNNTRLDKKQAPPAVRRGSRARRCCPRSRRRIPSGSRSCDRSTRYRNELANTSCRPRRAGQEARGMCPGRRRRRTRDGAEPRHRRERTAVAWQLRRAHGLDHTPRWT